jgi:hypothetical protein
LEFGLFGVLGMEFGIGFWIVDVLGLIPGILGLVIGIG